MELQSSYKAYVSEKDEMGNCTNSLVTRSTDQLPKGDVTIRVVYSSLNYKDALSATGKPGITKKYPHVPGIDAAGIVIASSSKAFMINDKVLVTGYDLGTNSDGGFAELIRVPEDWVVPLPESLSLKESMTYGTAGFTAALCIQALQHNGVSPNGGDVIVTGASGGVGSIAVAILAQEGYSVIASTGKKEAYSFLKKIGAEIIIDRKELEENSDFPLLNSRFQGAVDTVGGKTLETVIRSIKLQGSVAACGLVGGKDLNLTVFPFILRGVNLQGIDSMHWPMKPRREVWEKLAGPWKLPSLESLSETITLKELDKYIDAILKGRVQGRTIISME